MYFIKIYEIRICSSVCYPFTRIRGSVSYPGLELLGTVSASKLSKTGPEHGCKSTKVCDLSCLFCAQVSGGDGVTKRCIQNPISAPEEKRVFFKANPMEIQLKPF